MSASPPRALHSATDPAPGAITSLPEAAPALPSVLLAGFEPLYGELLKALLNSSRKLAVIDSAEVSWQRAAEVLCCHRPDVAVVCDEKLDIVDLAKLARQHPDTGIVVIARRLTAVRARALHACCAAAMLERGIDRWLLVLLTVAVACGIRGGMHMTPAKAAEQRADMRLEGLTEREAVVSEFLKEHRSRSEIAAALDVGLETVSSQAKSIYHKLGVCGRSELRGVLQEIEAPALDPEPSVPRIERATRERVAFRGPRPRALAGGLGPPAAVGARALRAEPRPTFQPARSRPPEQPVSVPRGGRDG
jgi:DNA-binding NarL/FixJ family response regulator